MDIEGEEWVTMAEIARRAGLTRERVRQLAEDWPIKRVQTVGNYRLFPWSEVEAYLAKRNPRPGGPKPKRKTEGEDK